MNSDVLLTLAGGVGLGSIVNQIISSALLGGRERRTLRADVLRALARVETGRWVTSEASHHADFWALENDLAGASLIARVDSLLIQKYLAAAAAAHAYSTEDYEFHDGDGDSYAGSVTSELAQGTLTLAAEITFALWRPVRFRFGKGRRIEAAEGTLRSFAAKRNDRHHHDGPSVARTVLARRYPGDLGLEDG